jgi:hypothetical protein
MNFMFVAEIALGIVLGLYIYKHFGDIGEKLKSRIARYQYMKQLQKDGAKEEQKCAMQWAILTYEDRVELLKVVMRPEPENLFNYVQGVGEIYRQQFTVENAKSFAKCDWDSLPRMTRTIVKEHFVNHAHAES